MLASSTTDLDLGRPDKGWIMRDLEPDSVRSYLANWATTIKVHDWIDLIRFITNTATGFMKTTVAEAGIWAFSLAFACFTCSLDNIVIS